MNNVLVVLTLISFFKHIKSKGEGVFEIQPVFVLSFIIALGLVSLFFPSLSVFVALFFLIASWLGGDVLNDVFSILIRPVKVALPVIVIFAVILIIVPSVLSGGDYSYGIIWPLLGMIVVFSSTFLMLWLMDIDNGYHKLTEKLINKQS